MRSTISDYCFALVILTLSACGTYRSYSHFVPVQSEHWIERSENTAKYNCPNGFVLTNGLITGEAKYSTLIGIPVPVNYGDGRPRLFLSIEEGNFEALSCKIHMAVLSSNDKEHMAESVQEYRTTQGIAAGLRCIFHFSDEIVQADNLTLSINDTLEGCEIPKLSLTKNSRSRSLDLDSL